MIRHQSKEEVLEKISKMMDEIERIPISKSQLNIKIRRDGNYFQFGTNFKEIPIV